MADRTRGPFEQVLGVGRSWHGEQIEFDLEGGRLGIRLNFEVGGTFACGGWASM